MVVSVEEVKTCRKCQMQIPVKATVCPYCRRSQTNAGKIVGIVLVLALLTVFVGIWATTHQNPAVFLRKNLETRVRGKTESPAKPDSSALIAGKKIKVGMAMEEVRSLIGKPYQINKALSEGMVTEQWVIKAGVGTQYLYFDNGILKTIETR